MNWNWGIYKTLSTTRPLNNSIDSIRVIRTKWPFDRVTLEFYEGREVLNRCREVHTWCVALVSSTLELRWIKLWEKEDEKEYLPRKFEIEETPNSYNFGVAVMAWCSCELSKAINCWHW